MKAELDEYLQQYYIKHIDENPVKTIEINNVEFTKYYLEAIRLHRNYSKEQKIQWSLFNILDRMRKEKEAKQVKVKIKRSYRKMTTEKSMRNIDIIWKIAVLITLILLAGHSVKCQTSQIDNIQFLDSTGAQIGTFAAPFKIKCGTGTACSRSGSTLTMTAAGSSGITSLNGLTASSQSFATGTTGTDFSISSTTSTHTFNIPTASSTNRGLLSSADWSTFNGKQNALGFTPENSANKGAASGYAPLNASTQLSNSYLRWDNSLTQFNPKDLSQIYLWLRADVGVIKDGSDKVSVWADQSGNARDWIQETAANQPTWVDATIGTKPAIVFDGLNSFLHNENMGDFGNDKPYTVFIVYKVSDANTGFMWVASDNAGSGWKFGFDAGSFFHYLYVGSSANLKTIRFSYSDTTLPLSVSLSTGYTAQQMSIYESGHYLLDQVGWRQTSVSTFNYSALGCNIYGDYSVPNSFFNGSIAEIIVFKPALPDAMLQMVYRYLNYKYDLQQYEGYPNQRLTPRGTAVTTAYDYTMTDLDYLVEVRSTYGNQTTTLPSLNPSVLPIASGFFYTVCRYDDSANTVSVATQSGDTFADGSTSYSLAHGHDCASFVGSDTSWGSRKWYLYATALSSPYLTAVVADAPLSGSGTSGSHLTISTASNVSSGIVSSMSTATSSIAVSTDDARMSDARTPTAHNQNASTIIIPNGYGSPAYDDMQDFLQETRSAGRISGGVVSAHAGPNGTVDISELQGMTFTTNVLGGNYIFFKQAAYSGLAVTDNSVSWIYFDYNGGSPQYAATTDRSTIHEYDQFTLGRVWRSGNTVEVMSTGHNLYNKDRRSHNRLILKYGNMDHVSGATLSAHSTPLRIQTDTGSWYVANQAYTTPANNTFKVWYRTGGGAWTLSNSLTLFSDVFDGGTSTVYTSYQNGTSLGSLGTSKYGVFWVFLCPEGNIYIVLGTASYNNVGAAQAASIPANLPPYCINWAKLIGRVICQNAAAALFSVESSFAVSFTLSTAVDHASLANLAFADSGHSGFAPSASPTFTGTPAAPTAAADTNTTQIATTAYVVGQAGSTTPIVDGTAAVGTSLKYARQDHVHPTDTSRAAATAIRTMLGANATYYVRTDGNDSNDGSANDAAHAFLTPQKCITKLSTLDLNGYDAICQLADGTYSSAGAVTFYNPVGRGDLYLKGNASTPTNVVITSTGNTTIWGGSVVGRTIYLQNFKVTSNTSSCIASTISGNIVSISGIDFGSCSVAHIYVTQGLLLVAGNYTISAAAAYHMYVANMGFINFASVTVTISNNPAFTIFAASYYNSTLQAVAMTYTGAATGKRYDTLGNSIISTGGGGANYFPGNSAGTTSYNGLYF